MDKLKISIAMCTYNGERFLREQLESILNQTRLPDELIVCDDKSSDKTLEILKNFSSQCPFPVHLFINKRNLGSTKNFEKAINNCNGDVIILADQDDVWHKEKINLIEKEFQKDKDIGLVFSDAHVVDFELQYLYNLWDFVGFDTKKKKIINTYEFTKAILERNFITGATMAFRSDLRKYVLPISEKWIHDAWISVILTSISKSRFIDTPLILYRQHSGNQIGAKKVKSKILLNRKFSFFERQEQLLKAYKYNLDIYNHINSKIELKTLFHKKNMLYLENKLAHLKKRISLSSDRRKRLYIIINELITLRYHKYSNGFRSAIKDLIIK